MPALVLSTTLGGSVSLGNAYGGAVAASFGGLTIVVGFLGWFASLNIPLVHFSVYWWRALHQPAALLGPGRAPMPEWMKAVVLVNWIAFTLLFAYFLSRRMQIARLEEQA